MKWTSLFLVIMLGASASCVLAQEPVVVTKKKKKKVTQAQRDQTCEHVTTILDKQPNLLKALADAQQQCMECVKSCIDSDDGWINKASGEKLDEIGRKALGCAQHMERLTEELIQVTQAMQSKN